MVALLGFALATLALVVYSALLASVTVPTPQAASDLVSVSEAFFAATVIGAALVMFDARRTLSSRSAAIRGGGVVPLSPSWMVPYVLSVGRYRKRFLASALLYGAFYAVITSMVVYQPTVDFGAAYGARIPSVQVTPLHAAPLFTPVVTVYLVNHVGLLLVPLTTLMLIATSVLVGVNFALASFAFDSRVRGAGRGWVGGIGALVGLFTGCPTCAGLFFASFLAGSGAVNLAVFLGYYQPAFILISIPVLLVAPYLTSRSLSRVFREGCVVLAKPG